VIVVRFKMQATPAKAAELRQALEAVVPASRQVPGVHYFDIAEDITNPAIFIATEVFADRSALAKQEELPEVATVMAVLPACLAEPPEATIYEVASSQPWG